MQKPSSRACASGEIEWVLSVASDRRRSFLPFLHGDIIAIGQAQLIEGRQGDMAVGLSKDHVGVDHASIFLAVRVASPVSPLTTESRVGRSRLGASPAGSVAGMVFAAGAVLGSD